MKKTLVYVLYFSFCCQLFSQNNKILDDTPIQVEARPWVKGKSNTKWKFYNTQTLDNIRNFEAVDHYQTNTYGSSLSNKSRATGFFYATQLGDRWWIIDPEGYQHLNISVVGVRQGKSETNKSAFKSKFDGDAKWMNATSDLLFSLKFSGTGSWSDEKTIDQYNDSADRPLTHTPILNFMSVYGKKRGGIYQLPGNTGYPNQCIFVFDKEFEAFCDTYAQKTLTRKDDHTIVGYFSDNELPIGKKNLEGYLSLKDESDAGLKMAQQWMKQKGITAEQITDQHRDEFAGIVAEKYYSVVANAIKKHAPNHMYLGSRLHGGALRIKEIVEAAGKYCDIVSINYYGQWTPEANMLDNWGQWAQKPFIVTEFYTKGMDAGLENTSGAGFSVRTQKDRGYAYQHFTLGLLESKNCVGWHWFKYQDNDPTDKTADPSNRDSNKGIMNNEYNPYDDLTNAMKQLNTNAYRLVDFFDNK